MRRRLTALCLVAVMLFTLSASVFAADSVQQYSAMKPATKASAIDEGYVYCCAQSNEPTFVKGTTAELSFKRRVATPSSGDNFIVEIYRGTAEDLVYGSDPTMVEKRTYSMSQFKSPNYTLTTTFKVDSKYSAGHYAVLWGIRNSAGKQYSGDTDYVMDMTIVNSEIPATGISCLVPSNKTDGHISVGETLRMYPYFKPENATTARNFTATSSEPNVASVKKDGGYFYVYGEAVGAAQITIRSGSLEEKFTIFVGDLYDFSISAGKTTLCVETTDTIRANVSADSSKVYVTWSSSNPAVATVKNGVVTAVSPGTATIYASCYGLTRAVTYTVNYHQLPANTPVTTRTATRPRQAVGYCSVCGKATAVNVYEPAIFTDTVPDAWYSQHVEFVYEHGLMNGTSDHTFAPGNPVTRGMVVTVLYRISGQPAVWGVSPFPDVPEGKYYTNAVIWAQSVGIVTGFNDGKYHPDENVTREQLATIIYRFAQACGDDVSANANLSGFPDAGQVHNYAKTAMGWAIAEGIITGVGKDGRTYLQPASSATRAQFATIISRYLQS